MSFRYSITQLQKRVSFNALLLAVRFISRKIATKHGKNELKLFFAGIFYFQNFIATIIKAIPAKAPITFTGVGIDERGATPEYNFASPLLTHSPLPMFNVGVELQDVIVEPSEITSITVPCIKHIVSKVRRVFERWLVVFNKKEKRDGVCWLF